MERMTFLYLFDVGQLTFNIWTKTQQKLYLNFCLNQCIFPKDSSFSSIDLKELTHKWKRAGLEGQPEKFDVIIGDLSDPHEGGPCNHLFTKSFYEEVIKPNLNDNGIFVTQVLIYIFETLCCSFFLLLLLRFHLLSLKCRLALLVFSPTRSFHQYTTP